MRFPDSSFLNLIYDGIISKRHFNTITSCIIRGEVVCNLLSLEIGIVDPPSNFNGKSMVWDEALILCSGGANDCFKYNSHSDLGDFLRWTWSSFFPKRWKMILLFSKEGRAEIIECVFWWECSIRESQVFQLVDNRVNINLYLSKPLWYSVTDTNLYLSSPLTFHVAL